jgi:hypothetical protein
MRGPPYPKAYIGPRRSLPYPLMILGIATQVSRNRHSGRGGVKRVENGIV